jgi:hypothetical protein
MLIHHAPLFENLKLKERPILVLRVPVLDFF